MMPERYAERPYLLQPRDNPLHQRGGHDAASSCTPTPG